MQHQYTVQLCCSCHVRLCSLLRHHTLWQYIHSSKHPILPCWCLQCAHIMAMAVQRLYKDAQVTIGPWIDRGFYYDFDMKQPLTEKDLKKIKKEMAKIMKMDLPFVKEEVRSWQGS
jgi:threonyl-tRNA synthetase